ncbi:MAG: type I-C CRISPR-associated protein Cas5 [Deltaproteobacteria bacterium]|nr:type I-C CRISPR-associated protein Cas5 [Deltaproteobacteria bacterium]
MAERPPLVTLRASGPLACFSRPEFSVERASYPWITPSAARAIFEAVFWKPRIRYEVREICLLAPIRFTSFRRNEVGITASVGPFGQVRRIQADKERQQRNTLALVDVDYQITAELYLNHDIPADGSDDNHGKYLACFTRRLERGQQFHQPYLGCREFAADVRLPDGTERPIPISMAHGLMLYDFRYPTTPARHREWEKGKVPRPLYFDARLVDGIVKVPSRADVLTTIPEAYR